MHVWERGGLLGDCISGPGLGTVSIPVISNVNLNNDNQNGGGPADNNITVRIDRFENVGYIDIEFNLSKYRLCHRIQVSNSVDDDTGICWSSYTMALGFGTGNQFVQSPLGDGLDFDAAPP